MKPPFALDLSEDGLALLFRVAAGWAELGRVSFDAPDLEARLADLRARADALAPGAVVTKLILPEAQILYTDVDAPGPDAASRRAQIAAALEGRTPYSVEELSFDWSRIGGRVKVAVVARLTLEEAEAFAEAQGFNPVAFVAIPPSGSFAGEPFFGLARNAAQHLPEGARLDRDQDPVQRVEMPAEIAATLGAASSRNTAGLAELEPAEANVPPSGVATFTESDIAGADAAFPADAAEADLSADPATEGSAQGEPDTGPDAAAGAAPDAAAHDVHPVGDAAPEAPFIAVEDDAENPPGPAGGSLPDAEAEVRSAPAFASRRQGQHGTTEVAARLSEATARLHLLADAPGAAALPRATPLAAAVGTTITAPAIDLPHTVAPGDVVGAARRKAFGRAVVSTLPEARHGTQAQLRERQAPPLPGATAGIFGAHTPAPRRTPSDRRRLGLVLTAALLLLMAAVALWSVWFGADPAPRVAAPSQDVSATSPRPGDPGRDTGAVVVADAAPAPVSESAPSAAEPPVPEAPVSEVRAQVSPADEVAVTAAPADPATDAVTAALAEALSPETAGSAAPDPALTAAPADAAEISPSAPDVAAERPAPIWTGAPDGAATAAEERSSGVATLSVDTPPETAPHSSAPLVLPAAAAAAAADPLPQRQPLPPPFGTVIAFGPDGRIVATPEGVITPDGFMLFAGKPPLVPPAAPRPGAALPVAPAPAEAPAEAAAPAPLPAPVDPAHAAKKPLVRPEAILDRAAAARAAPSASPTAIPEPAAPEPALSAPAATEGALPPPVDPAHAALPPKSRPAVVVARAEAARTQAEAIAAAAEAAARAEAEALAKASRLAVASSQRPFSRPSGLAKAVEAAIAAAVAAPEPAPEPAAAPAPEPAPAPAPAVAAAPAPEEVDEPEPVETVPNMPTTVTVARQATVKNAIDLGKINLIGVYGSSANRRALIRMPTGRLIKVKIGDRLDGGQVAAIGDSEVTYVKGGRSFTLKIQKNG